MNAELPRTAGLRPFLILLSALMLLSLAGCGLFGGGEEDEDEDLPAYVRSSETERLAVPDDLDPPRTDVAMAMQADNVPPLVQPPATMAPPQVMDDGSRRGQLGEVSFGARGPYIELEDSSDSVFRRLGLAIERSGINAVRAEPENLRYVIDYQDSVEAREASFLQRLMFWRDDPQEDLSGTYYLQLEAEDPQRTRVYLVNQNGGQVRESAAYEILSVFKERLG